jgi:hypothetical protein
MPGRAWKQPTTHSHRLDPGDIAAQSKLICAPRQAIAEAVPAVQNGGYRMSHDCRVVTVCNQMPDPVADDE